MVALMVSVPVTAVTFGDSLWSEMQSGALEPEGWRGGPLEELLADPLEGDDALLRMLDHIGATPETANVPVASHVLGSAAPAQALPALYEARALSSTTPLRNALVAYNTALDLMDTHELLESAELRMADELPVDAQVAIAVLLYALTDASLLQKQAVSGLSPEDYTALMGLPGMILSGRLDPTDSSEAADEDFAATYGLLSQVDKQRIDEAALIMVHSVSHALPTLRDWAERERTAPQDPRVAEIGSLLDPYTPERIEAMDPIERLDILADTLRMAAGFQEVQISPYLEPLPVPQSPTPLRDAILGLAAVLEGAGIPLDVVEEQELRRADGLPRSLQLAVARIVTNQAAVVQASLDLNEVVAALESSLDPEALADPESIPDLPESQREALVAALGDLRRAEVRTVLAVQESAPTIEAWGLVWGHDPSMLASLPGQEHRRGADAAAWAEVMADPGAPLQQVMLRAARSSGLATEVEEPPLPERGTLGPAVLSLYDRLGVEATADERDAVIDGALALPERVERNVARVILAQVEAMDELEAQQAALDPADRAALAEGSGALARLSAGESSLRDVQSIRAYYEVVDRVDGAFLSAAAGVAAAVDASSRDLAAFVDETTGDAAPEEEGSSGSKPWYSTAWSFFTSIRIIGTASAQSGPGEPYHVPPACPASTVSDCANDVWFMDPVRRTIVVSGFGPTEYTPQKMGGDGQILSVALGGDDVYRNNAGAAGGQIPVAVAIDLGGDDRYLPTSAGFAYDVVQGAAAAGIGILYDRRGDDRYVADVPAQGFGGPGSAIGVLLDGDGDDRYVGGMEGQGTGGGYGAFVDLQGDDQHSRTHADGSTFGDGECWTSARAPQGDGYDVENETFEDPNVVADGASVYGSSFANDTVRVATTGHGFFVDLGASGCTVPGAGDGPDPESAEELVGSILGSEYLVEIPTVLVVGDEADTHYPGCEVEETSAAPWAQGAASREICDWVVNVDLGGNDTYENRAGGLDTGIIFTVPRYIPGVLVDVRGDDLYNNTRAVECVQGCDATLIDLDGNDTYLADFASQGIARSLGKSGILFDAAGDDRYTIQRMSGLAQGAVLGAVVGIGILLDVSGDDAYRSPSQGAINSPLTGTGVGVVAGFATAAGWASASFLDLSGDDQYQPAGLQGRVDVVRDTDAGSPARAPSVNSRGSGTGIFVDTQGHDGYVGTPENPAGPDVSRHHNDRFRIQSHGGVFDWVGVTTLAHAAPGLAVFLDMARGDDEAAASQVTGLQQPADLHDASFRIGALGIAIGTTGADVVNEDYALFIDPGGNDAYRNNAGGTVLRAIQDTTVGEPTTFEEGGLSSTTYDPHRNYPLASLLVDLDGDDLYAADDAVDPNAPSPRPTNLKGILTQGAGFLGTGVLVDEAGNPAATAAGADTSGAADDTYVARAMSQGFGLYGWGILWDRTGDDTYRYDPAVVRDPVLDGNVLAWLQYAPLVTDLRDPITDGAPDGPGGQAAGPGSAGGASGATWNLHMRDGSWSRDCRIVVPGFGQGIFYGLAVAREAENRLAYSVVDDGLWRLHQVADLPQSGDPCPGGNLQLDASEHMMREVEAIGGPRPASNQVNPQFVQIQSLDSILWQDDRDGTWSFYHKRLSHAVNDPAIPLGQGILGGHESGASNQQNPHVHGSQVVYQDDRHAGHECPEGTSSIQRLNLNTFEEAQVSQGCGFHVKPQVSGAFVVWQTRASEEDAWRIAIYNLADDELRILDAPGEQYAPVVSDRTILYTDAQDGHRIMQYDWDTNTSRVERFDAVEPVLDAKASFRAAWVDTTGRDATIQAPTASAYWEIHRKDLSSEAQPNTGGIRQSSVAGSVASLWMTGASYANGRGVLFDEGGVDEYNGDRFTQGAAASLVGPSTNFNANNQLVGPSEIDAFAVLVDSDGNDAYSAQRESQGVHFARELVSVAPPNPPPPLPGLPVRYDLETTASMGLLLDLRGNDEYVANRNSQGYGAWALGAGTTVAACVGQQPHPGCPPYRLWAVESFGIFMDLGGLDTYRYPQPLYQEISVEDDFCGTADTVAARPLRSLVVGHNDTLRDTIGGFSTVGVYDEDGNPESPPPPADVAEAEQELFDRDNFNQTFNDTVERPLWSLFEGVPDEIVNQIPPEVREALDKNSFQALEDGVDSILTPLVELCQEVEGAAMAQKNAAEEELTGEPAGEAGERNNALWRQKPRGGIEDGDGGRAAAPTPFVLGGVGMDLPLLDNLNRALMEGANRLIQTELQVSATDQHQRLFAPGDPLQGKVNLTANVTFTDSSEDLGLEFDRAEFFADRGAGFRILGTVVDSDRVGDRFLFIRPWHTDSEQFPDGEYELRTRVHYKHPASGFNLGYAQNNTTFLVDNLPRILPDLDIPLLSDSLSAAPITAFSPFPYGDDQIPGHPVVTFGLSADDPGARDARGHDGWARIDVLDENGDIAATIFDGTLTSDQGASETWTGTDTDDDVVPSGRYLVRIQATDLDPGAEWADVDETRVRNLTSPVVVYSNTPQAGCVRSALEPACNAGATLNVDTGQVDASGVLRVPLSLSAMVDRGAAPAGLQEIRRFHVRLGQGTVDDITWLDPETLGVGSSSYELRIRDGDTWHVIALAEDRAGNLECAPACGQPTAASVLRGIDSTLLAAFDEKLGTPGVVATFAADLQRPSIRNAKVFVDDEPPASLVPRMGADDRPTIAYQVEEENGEPIAVLEWWHEEDPRRVEIQTSEDDEVDVASGDCQNAFRPCYNVTWDGWSALVDSEGDEWKEGIVKARLGAQDLAGNPVRLRDQPAFEFLLDRTPPTIEDVRVVYPEGRFHAEQGDEVRVLIQVSDPILSGFVTQPRDLHLNVHDASQVTSAADVDDSCILRFEPGLCFQSQLKAWETVIPIDDTAWSDVENLRAARLQVAVNVTDVAGNTNQTLVELVLGAPMLMPEQVSQAAGVFGATTTWSTNTTETKAYVMFGQGTKASDLQQRIDSVADDGTDHVGTVHEFAFEDLRPGTSYVYRFFAVDPESNATEAGPLTTLNTLHGVDMKLLAPRPDAEEPEVLSGLYTVRGEGWVQSAVDDENLTIEPRVVVRLRGPGLPETGRVAFDGFTEDGRFELDLVTDALEDGVHTMEVTVSYLDEEVATVVGDLMVDNTPPRLDIVEPTDESVLREAPHRILVRATENLTAVNESSVRVLVGGRLADADVAFTPDGDAHHGVIEVTGLPRFPRGIVPIKVFAEDMAGNPGFADIRVLFDPDAPEVTTRVAYPGGQQAARPGQWVVVEVADESDDVGIERVTANTTAFGGGASVDFVRQGGRFALDLPVPAAQDEGTFFVPVDVTDAAGNAHLLVAEVVVDGTVPSVVSLEFAPLEPRQAVAEVETSEPATVVLNAVAEGVDTVRVTAGEFATVHLLDLDGLQAGVEYTIEVRVRDGAGNEAASTQSWRFLPDVGDVPAVRNLTADATPTQVRLTWDEAGDGFRYAVHRAESGAFETVAVAFTPRHTDLDVVGGHSYRYFVQAQDPEGLPGAPSAVVEVQVPALEIQEEGVSLSVHPKTGVAADTTFVFTATLEGMTDADPSVWLVVDDENRRMIKGPGEDCREACTFRHATQLTAIDLRNPSIEYYVEVFDASGVTRLPEVGSLQGPTVLAQDGEPHASDAEAPGLPILMVMVVLAGMLYIRRRESL